MSQTITYKTKYKSLDSILKVVDELAAEGKFGKQTQVQVKGDKDFNPGLFRPRDPNEEVVIVVRDHSNEMFSREGGFYEPGFAIAINKETKEITIVYDYNSGANEKTTVEIRKKLEQMIEAGDTLNKVKTNLGGQSESMTVNKTSDTEWSVELEFTPEQLKNFMAKR